jgi:hypothetical protein
MSTEKRLEPGYARGSIASGSRYGRADSVLGATGREQPDTVGQARHSYDRWLVAGHGDTPSLATLHAYHTHEALHEAARAITMIIDTFRAEAAALITTPARGINISTPAPVTTRQSRTHRGAALI